VGRRYSDEEKAQALAALDANGGNVAKTARQIGVPRKTLAEWAADRHTHDDVAEIRQRKKIDLAQQLENIARQIADALPDKIQAANLQQAATSMAIAIDKMQLLRGAPTSISDIAIEQIADRIERMTEDERAVLARQLGADYPEAEAE
jgi:transposase-like protein